jgi:hypothetical protein
MTKFAMWQYDNDNIKQEDRIKALIDIESREFNGKWYTTVKARKIDLLSSSNEVPENMNVESPINGSDDLDDFLNDDVGELPF